MDEVWNSCPYAEAIIRLKAHKDPYPHLLDQFPDSGHYVGSFIPYEPTSAPDPVDEQAREKLWPHLLTFLADL